MCRSAGWNTQSLLNQKESSSRPGDPCKKGECDDYSTETENKHLKPHLSPGILTVNSWIKASRNYAILTKTRDAVFKGL